MISRDALFSDALAVRSDRATWGYAAWIVAGCVALGAIVIAWPVLKDHGFPLDDSWIHQVIGRNAAVFGAPGYIPGVATAGSSSAIWPWIIAINYRVLSFIPPTVYLLAFNVVCSFAIAFVLFSAALRDGLRPVEIVLLAALPSITGNFAWLLSSGMEHLLFIAAVFLAAHFWISRSIGTSAAPPLLAGIFCGLSIATRPEASAFLPVFLVVGWWLGRSRRDLILFVLPCLIFISFVVITNVWTSHSVMPVTFSGRKWLYFYGSNEGPVGLVGDLLMSWAFQIVKFFLFVDLAKGNIGNKLLAAICLCAVLLGVFRLIRQRAWHTSFLVLLAAINFLIYCVMLPTSGHAMRYQAMTLVFIFPLMAMGGLECVTQLSARFGLISRVSGPCSAIVVGSTFILALFSLLKWSGITDDGIKHINGTHVRMGKWLTAHLPPNTRVAAFDIGGIGYFGNVRVVDLGGLTDPGFVPYLYAGKSAEYLRQQHIDFVVLPTMMGHEGAAEGTSECDDQPRRLRLCNGAAIQKTEVVAFSTPPDVWGTAFLATGHAAPMQVLYRIVGNQ
jgi:hypothetical protein